MRKALEIAGWLILLFLWAVTAQAIWGPEPLPRRIPTHFNYAGQPDGWGTPGMLWVLPAMAAGILLLMTLVARFPAAFNFPVRITPRARPQLEAIALSMISCLKVEVAALFAWIQCWTVHMVRQGQGRFSPAGVPLLLTAVLVTIAWHIVRMRKVAYPAS